ncbi:hypothetical protein E2C01_009499 [Portunus trituberculatus]|uniref:Uncharacterized protein n=1 Tax=Portunus trituberculatus TaxID=210409 RepID=A0A5B7D5Y0_PORTR|nr:hypothetical protein [Portunus trituberculatus]
MVGPPCSQSWRNDNPLWLMVQLTAKVVKEGSAGSWFPIELILRCTFRRELRPELITKSDCSSLIVIWVPLKKNLLNTLLLPSSADCGPALENTGPVL